MNKMLCLVGGSCAGKTTLAKYLEENGMFSEAISTTTRPPRAGENDGIDYYFTSKADFVERIVAGQFLEFFEFNGNYYGTSVSEIRRIIGESKTPVLVIEPNGAHNLAKWSYENPLEEIGCVLVYLNSNYETTYTRFLDRAKKDIVSGSKIDKDNLSVENTIDMVAKRLSISIQEESNWSSALDYDLKVGPMISSECSMSALLMIKDKLACDHNVVAPRELRTEKSDSGLSFEQIKRQIERDLVADGIIVSPYQQEAFNAL